MSDKSDDSDKKKGLFINAKGVSCIPCKCKRPSYHQETKTVKENNIITIIIVEDRRNLKFGGRHVSPDESGIFKSDSKLGALKNAILDGVEIKLLPKNSSKR